MTNFEAIKLLHKGLFSPPLGKDWEPDILSKDVLKRGKRFLATDPCFSEDLILPNPRDLYTMVIPRIEIISRVPEGDSREGLALEVLVTLDQWDEDAKLPAVILPAAAA